MADSFRYCVEHQAEMLYPFRGVPWPILFHTANSDVPIPERVWALQRYRGRDSTELLQASRDLPRPAIPVAPDVARKWERLALPRLVLEGGPCGPHAYYQTAICQAFGMPAFGALGRTDGMSSSPVN